jgi:Xaa-Pro aminopeptidase
MLLLYRGESFDPNFFYHSGTDIDHSFLLVDGKRKTLLVNGMNEALARSRFRGRVVVYRDALETLSRLIRRKAVLFDGQAMSARMARKLGALCRLKDHSPELLAQRAAKNPAEVSDIRKAVRKTKEIFESLDLRAARTELDLQKQLMVATAEMGLEQAFEPIVSSGPGTSYPHYQAGRRKLGDLVLVDYGVKANHYCSDLTRCFIRGRDRKMKEQYERLQDICWFLADSLPALERGKDIAKLSSDLIKKAGFPPLIHSIGHGVGLEIHELPRLGMKSEDRLAGTAIAIEPAFYLAGRYGMRYEETVWFDGKRGRVL